MKNYIEVKSLPDQNITITDNMINCVEISGLDINLKCSLIKIICRSTIKIDTKNKKAIINCTDTAKENTDVVIRNIISILDKYRSINIFNIGLFIGDDKLMKLSFSTILEYHFLEGASLIIILDFSKFKEYRKSTEDKDKKSDCLILPNHNSDNGNILTHVDNFVASVSSELVNDDDFYKRYAFISNLNILYSKCDSVVVNYDHNKIIIRCKESEDAVRICTYMFDNFDVIANSSFYVFIDEIIDVKGEGITKSNIRFDSVYIHSLDYHRGKGYNIEVVLSFTDYKVLKSETIPYDSNNNEQQNEKDDKLDYCAIINYEDIEFITFSPRYPNYPKSRAVFDIAFQKIILDALYLNTDNKYTLNLDKGEILVEFSDDALNKTIDSSLSLLGLGTNVVFDGSINDLVKYLKDTNTKSCDVDLDISIQLNKKIPFINNDGKWMYGNLIDICASSITYNKHDLSKFTINYTAGDIVVYNE